MPPALPRLWLMTDDARGDAEAAMARLPQGAGIIFRHYAAPDREAIGARLHSLARTLGHLFLVAGDPRLAARLDADGFHAPEALAHRIVLARRLLPRGIVTMAVHDARGLTAAKRYAPDSILVSPVFATASHAQARTLGPVRFAALAHASSIPVIALGGMNAARFGRLNGSRAHGFAGISFA
ncbi:MAG: thiamine phosphate synthase [Micropepsaceae bacterium]